MVDSVPSLSSQDTDVVDFPISLPYYAPDIPAPLPTVEEIENLPNPIKTHKSLVAFRVTPHFVVKFGAGVDLIEGENMLFVRQATNIPVPKLYALYSDPQTGKNYIVMEHIAGETLESLWPSLTEQDKDMVIAKLRQYFDELRQLPSPGYFGRLGGRPLRSYFLGDLPISGPLETEDALNVVILHNFTQKCDSQYRVKFYRQSLPHIFRDHKPVFTHGDLQQKNILVRKAARNPDPAEVSDGGDELEVYLVNWELSGWYPDYWEYCVIFCLTTLNTDWLLRIGKALEPYYCEASWLERMLLEYY
ncbi:hypothetical protein EV182_001519 [Spiromyces aspiralis]|uniref:Uncharacterized protein n=1 Tax=Spiromyces aspiralis TaxID=68401 RepID=A0ACC1HJK2_9FUNG|nr:hypothetical protein EV182_001519 [Spiromyces aspiralis]